MKVRVLEMNDGLDMVVAARACQKVSQFPVVDMGMDCDCAYCRAGCGIALIVAPVFGMQQHGGDGVVLVQAVGKGLLDNGFAPWTYSSLGNNRR